MVQFGSPTVLLLAPLALGAAWLLSRRRARGGARLPLPADAGFPRPAASRWVHVERSLPWMRALALLLAVVALARPQAGAREEIVTSEGVDVVVSLDVSGSMRCEDTRPLSRLAVAKDTVRRFVEGRPNDRVGLVVFASMAATRCPLTLDHALLQQFTEDVDFAPVGEDRTALGLGLATAVNRLRGSSAKSKVVVLVTDGRNNEGQIGPEAAAEAARALGIRVYTIGVGALGEAPCPVDRGRGGVSYVMQRVELDEPTLESIATMNSGRYFRAADAEGMREAFETIDALETTERESRVRVLYTELYRWVLIPAGILLLFEGLLRSTRLRRIP